MRTTIRLPDELYGAVRREALEQETTVTSYIEAALRRALAAANHETSPFTVTPFVGSGTRPGVDLDDSGGLTDLMEG